MSATISDSVRAVIDAALAEDVGSGDITTLALVPRAARATADVVAREPLAACGIAFAQAVFRRLSRAVRFSAVRRDGELLAKGGVLFTVEGPARALLTAERTALNLLQRLSGIATATARAVELVRGTGAAILDTRKTTPGWRALEKYAVSCGGGVNHRQGLFDAVLIKDNHLAYCRGMKLADVVAKARAACPGKKIEIEVDTFAQLRDALAGNPDWILLDNFSPARLRKAVALCKGRVKTEASGGITLATLRAHAEAGVDAVSLGALTQSARAVDIALDFR
ncbi:MAG: carboxylating nicotinate-nucleotide diphosphorylase [Kiritimatiellae bacterium]|nr:carboxylating nicotinate-nucleotide diphosphorylase [Kiritimatiellia bacterium]